jgi:hypothetical protein
MEDVKIKGSPRKKCSPGTCLLLKPGLPLRTCLALEEGNEEGTKDTLKKGRNGFQIEGEQFFLSDRSSSFRQGNSRSTHSSPGKLTDLFDIPRVIPSLINRGLADQGEISQGGSGEDPCKSLFTDPAQTDMFMAVEPRAEIALRIVQVNEPQVFQTECLIKPVQGLLKSFT